MPFEKKEGEATECSENESPKDKQSGQTEGGGGNGCDPDPGSKPKGGLGIKSQSPEGGCKPDGTWTFEPCYLKGTGYYKGRHEIHAMLTTPNGMKEEHSVENIATK